MRTSFHIVDMGSGRFGVQVTEGDVTSSHEVLVPEDLVTELGYDVGDVAPEMIVREALAFLLERVPATSIAPEVSLAAVSDEYDDFDAELRTRLAGATA
jgi:hypothetical protein